MDVACLNDGEPGFPSNLETYLGENAPSRIATLGYLDVLSHPKMAVFCSAQCPATLILQIHDLARQWAQSGATVISGFHSPVEKECLRILLAGTQPVILCPARSLVKMRIRKEWRKPLDEGRLLFLSAFPDHRHRSDTEMAFRRNRFVAALADRIFVPYASPASKTEGLCKEVMAWGKPLYILESEFDGNLTALGAKAIRPNKPIILSAAE